MKKIIASLLIGVLALTMIACGGETEETTVSGIVVSVSGNEVTMMSFGDKEMPAEGETPAEGEKPSMPDGETFAEGEMPSLPNGETPAEGEKPSLPDGETLAEGETPAMPSMPEGETPAEGETLAEGESPAMPSMPEGETLAEGERPSLPDGETLAEGEAPKGGFDPSSAETQTFDLTGVHISIEIDEGKATGSIEDITEGTFITVTLNSKGEPTNVLVSSSNSFEKKAAE